MKLDNFIQFLYSYRVYLGARNIAGSSSLLATLGELEINRTYKCEGEKTKTRTIDLMFECP